MLFCPECKELSVSYVNAFNLAFCTNGKLCSYKETFESWDACKETLGVSLKKWVHGLGKTIAPWSGAVIETDMDEETLVEVTNLAKELHGVFTQASIDNAMMTQENAMPFETTPENVRDALVELACYIHDHFIRRKDD